MRQWLASSVPQFGYISIPIPDDANCTTHTPFQVIFKQLKQILVPTYSEKLESQEKGLFGVTVQPLERCRNIADIDLDVPAHMDVYCLGCPNTVDVMALIGADESCRWNCRRWEEVDSDADGCVGLGNPCFLSPSVCNVNSPSVFVLFWISLSPCPNGLD